MRLDVPIWGHIAHNGWASPSSPDLPDLQYTSVILELPHLIEARAVTVAPPDPDSVSNPPMPDIRAVDLLQRPASMGLRDYIGHLIEVGVLNSGLTTEFLAAYEYARFGPQPLSEREFRNIMRLFADVLRSVQPLSPAILASLGNDTLESDIDDDASSTSTPRSRSQASRGSVRARSGSEGTIHTVPSRRVATNGSSLAKRDLVTAPATPKSKRVLSNSPSIHSFSQSRKPYAGSSSSSTSLVSSSQGSVIRLSPTDDPTELLYTLMVPKVG